MKALLLYASAGAGHKRAAEALAVVFGESGLDTTVQDILDFTPALFRKTYTEGYLQVVRTLPELWGYMYARSDRKTREPWEKKIRAGFNKLNTIPFLRSFKKLDPDIVVCTHFMPLEILTTRLGARKGRAPVFCVVTDFAAHSLWLCSNVACYYVATDDARRQLLRSGQPADRIKVTGIPVDPSFGRREAQGTVRKRLGMDPRLPLALVISGGFGVGPTAELLLSFRDSKPTCQIVVVAGRNEEMKREAEAAARKLPVPVKVLGFVNNVHELMDAADVIVSKPGGLTSSEVLAKGKPMVIVDPIPGQEQRNCEYLLEAGAAIRLFDIADAAHRIQTLIADTGRLALLSRNARRLGRPAAASDIVRDISERTRRKVVRA
jgi:processive 1,2-diacylglycerol beta-glucosyltransferase